MVGIPSLTEEEKARILQAVREDAAFREEMRRLLLGELQASVQDLQGSVREVYALLNRFVVVVEEGFQAVNESIRALAEQVQENGRQIAALTTRMERVEAQIAALTAQVEANSRQIARLTEQVQENSRQIAALREQVEEHGRQIATLTERLDRLTAQVEQNTHQIGLLIEQVRENGRQIAALTGEVREQRFRLDDVSGVAAEAAAYRELLIWLRSRGIEVVREYLAGDLKDRLGVTSVPDGLMLLRSDSGYVLMVYEITFTIALYDVERIAEWLEAFRKVGWPVIGLVHYRRALPEEEKRERIWEDGREIVRITPGMRSLREEAERSGVLLMQHGASPWRPAGWQPPAGMATIPEELSSPAGWA